MMSSEHQPACTSEPACVLIINKTHKNLGYNVIVMVFHLAFTDTRDLELRTKAQSHTLDEEARVVCLLCCSFFVSFRSSTPVWGSQSSLRGYTSGYATGIVG
jgi:hypothetical protein